MRVSEGMAVPDAVAAVADATYRALYDYTATETDELSLREGDVVVVDYRQLDNWWYGVVHGEHPRSGLFPGSYVCKADEFPEKGNGGLITPRASAPAAPTAQRETAAPAAPDAVVAAAAPVGAATAAPPVAVAAPAARAAVAAPPAASPVRPPAPAVSPARPSPTAAGKPEALPSAKNDALNDELAALVGANHDETLNLILELESRARTAEASLGEERAAAAAFRAATTASLKVLESTLVAALAPLRGVLVEAPRGDAAIFEVGPASGGGGTLGDAVAAAVAARARATDLGRRAVTWDDFCAALESVAVVRGGGAAAPLPRSLAPPEVPLATPRDRDERRNAAHALPPSDPGTRADRAPSYDADERRNAQGHIPAAGAGETATTRRVYDPEDRRPAMTLDSGAAGAAGAASPPPPAADYPAPAAERRRPSVPGMFSEADAARVERLLDRFRVPLRELFRNYASSRPRSGPSGPSGRSAAVVSPPDFLKCCRERGVTPALLSSAQCATVCRAALGESGATRGEAAGEGRPASPPSAMAGSGYS